MNQAVGKDNTNAFDKSFQKYPENVLDVQYKRNQRQKAIRYKQ